MATRASTRLPRRNPQKFAVGRHHSAVVAVTPDGVKKRIADTAFVTGAAGPEIAGVLVIDGLHGEHNTALNYVLPYVRSVAFSEGTPAFTPLGRALAPLIERRPDRREDQVVEIEKMPPVIAQFIGYAERFPLLRLRAGSSRGWSLCRRIRLLLRQRESRKSRRQEEYTICHSD